MKKIRFQNKPSIGVFLLMLAIGLFSCHTDLLDPKPQTVIQDIFVFDTPERVALQINGLYTSVKSGQFLGGRYQIYGDIRANDFINRTSNGVTGYLVWQHTLTEQSQNDVINMWNAAYAAINQINVFLQGMEDYKDKFVQPTFPATFATTAEQYKAEARFLRALSYHCLLQLYARPYIDGAGSKPGLPLRLTAQKDALGNDMARSTVAQVYDQIIADLDFAEANLPLTYSTSTTRITRAHRNTAIALKTRVYLTKGDNASLLKLIEEANKIVSATAPYTATSGVAHALQANVANVFASPQETLESILSMPFSTQNTPGTQNQLGFYYRSNANGAVNPGGAEFSLNSGTSATTGGITGNTTLWPTTDQRRTNFVYTVGTSTERFLGKYPSGTPYLDNAPVIRYAEVLLNLSEAIARTTAGVDAKALSLLNAVRVRSAGLIDHDSNPVTPTIPDLTWAPADNATLISNILTERRIEFLGEGLRNSDIMRLNQPFPAKGSVPSLPVSSSIYAWPIPSTELATNLLIVRNE